MNVATYEGNIPEMLLYATESVMGKGRLLTAAITPSSEKKLKLKRYFYPDKCRKVRGMFVDLI